MPNQIIDKKLDLTFNDLRVLNGERVLSHGGYQHTLDCFGRSGLEMDLERVFDGESQRKGQVRAGIDYAEKGVRHG